MPNFLLTKLPVCWQDFLAPALAHPSFAALSAFVEEAYQQRTTYPPRDQLFRAFALTPPEKLKCVLLGQDPYHGPGQAEGLCFSVPAGVKTPPSLRNIFKEYQSDTGHPPPLNGCLVPWAEEGVLLLNAVLTVETGQAGAHAGKGWEIFTDNVIAALSREAARPLVFILWGSYAQKKKSLIDTGRHAVLTAVHPSPLSAHRGFFGSRPFSRTNAFLAERGLPPVDWRLPHQQELLWHKNGEIK